MTAATLMLASRDVQDTVAYVPRPGGPIDTSAYMWTGYAIVWLTLALYLVLLFRRMARVRAMPTETDARNRQ